MRNHRLLQELSALVVVCSLAMTARAQDAETKSYPVVSGIGLALDAKDGHVFARFILPKSPAEESGRIKEGSQLVSVEFNGESVSLDGKSVGEAAGLIRGPVGTKIVLTFVLPNEETRNKVTLLRKPLEIESVPDSSYKSFIGKTIPELKLSSMERSSTKDFSEFRGRIVVLDFWASWCATCYPPVTKMQKIHEDHPQWNEKVVLATVTVDSELSEAIAVIKQRKWDRTQNYSINPEDFKSIGASLVPLVIIVAANGTIVTMADAHAVDVVKEVEALLANQIPDPEKPIEPKIGP